ncbi:MAG: hypothetical protein KJ787_13100 [Gammaproteobacteria bacterium]|nr:hypothetical protein [Gammaproteobacteria bacterium]MBU1647261.1 hypothetical protein [Gammaproteobacteria bacterium]MBU1972773.1 hypothetical protein [Gammaproteobacteria bacterium]
MLDPDAVALLGQLGISPEMIEASLSALLFLTILTVATAIPTAVLAKRKGRSVTGWVILALSLPVVPLLLIWLLPKLDTPARK